MTYHKTLQRFLNVHNFPESGKGAPPDRILKNLCRCHCSRVVLQDSPSDQRRLLGMRSDGESLSLHDFWGIMASALISSLNPGTTFYRSLESYAITACPCIISWMFLYIHLSLYVVYRGVPWSIGRELCTKTKKYLAALHLLSILRDLHVKVHHSFHAFFWGEEPTAICQCEPKKGRYHPTSIPRTNWKRRIVPVPPAESLPDLFWLPSLPSHWDVGTERFASAKSIPTFSMWDLQRHPNMTNNLRIFGDYCSLILIDLRKHLWKSWFLFSPLEPQLFKLFVWGTPRFFHGMLLCIPMLA